MATSETSAFQHPPGDIVVVGAGGFAADTFYLRNLRDMEIHPSKIALVDSNADRLQAAQEKYGAEKAYLDLGDALVDIHERRQSGVEAHKQGQRNIAAFIIASSTAAHADNLKTIAKASDNGLVDLKRAPIWCEKPVTPPETFNEISALAATHPDLDISVGYILRYSETLNELQRYLGEQGAAITSLEWIYGKDRRHDKRPTQGVLSDELVHSLSVTDLIFSRAFGKAAGVAVASASIQRQPFADPEVQAQARRTNPEIPEHPISDVDTELRYMFGEGDSAREVPVRIYSSFLLDTSVRQVQIAIDSPAGPEVLTLDFDVTTGPADARVRSDVLRKSDGTVVSSWSGDKARAQITSFLGAVCNKDHRVPDAATSLETESGIQSILRGIEAASTL